MKQKGKDSREFHLPPLTHSPKVWQEEAEAQRGLRAEPPRLPSSCACIYTANPPPSLCP